jgi:5-deoxy-glucuronate isomerase
VKETARKYAAKIERNEADPVLFYDGRKSGLLLDPQDPATPLSLLGFGIHQLENGPFSLNSGKDEYVIVPQRSRFRVKISGGNRIFEGERGDPFTDDFETNACAIYIPADTPFTLEGEGECIFYRAPATARRPARFVAPGETRYVSRGLLSWRRDVVTLVTPQEISSNLVVGETYSPPGLWSGTPLHRHDGQLPQQGESDHEEVYYHIMRYRGDPAVPEAERIGPYGVQLLFDGANVNKSYIVRDKTIVAIPGVCHPVVASPVTDHIYGWGLAGSGADLGMLDLAEFRYLKDIEKAFKDLNAAVELPARKVIDDRGMLQFSVSVDTFDRVAANYRLNPHQKMMLKLMAREYGLAFKERL